MRISHKQFFNSIPDNIEHIVDLLEAYNAFSGNTIEEYMEEYITLMYEMQEAAKVRGEKPYYQDYGVVYLSGIKRDLERLISNFGEYKELGIFTNDVEDLLYRDPLILEDGYIVDLFKDKNFEGTQEEIDEMKSDAIIWTLNTINNDETFAQLLQTIDFDELIHFEFGDTEEKVKFYFNNVRINHENCHDTFTKQMLATMINHPALETYFKKCFEAQFEIKEEIENEVNPIVIDLSNKPI